MSNLAPAFWRDVPSSVLLEPKDYRSSAWSGHVPFAFWLVNTLRPGILVELGTWYGMSYLAFCQAVQTFGTGTKAFAVDTWQGDAHTGPLAKTALSSLRRAHDPSYSDFSTLLQKTFDAAVSQFEDGSVDLLHIDGLHTYEAVKHDFETWLPKLSNRAIILFHDTRVREKDFGVYRLWEELTSRYPHFEFHHDYGLGVLGVGPQNPAELQKLFAASGAPDEAARVREVFERFGKAVRATQTADETRHELDAIKSNLAVRAFLKARRVLRGR